MRVVLVATDSDTTRVRWLLESFQRMARIPISRFSDSDLAAGNRSTGVALIDPPQSAAADVSVVAAVRGRLLPVPIELIPLIVSRADALAAARSPASTTPPAPEWTPVTALDTSLDAQSALFAGAAAVLYLTSDARTAVADVNDGVDAVRTVVMAVVNVRGHDRFPQALWHVFGEPSAALPLAASAAAAADEKRARPMSGDSERAAERLAGALHLPFRVLRMPSASTATTDSKTSAVAADTPTELRSALQALVQAIAVARRVRRSLRKRQSELRTESGVSTVTSTALATTTTTKKRAQTEQRARRRRRTGPAVSFDAFVGGAVDGASDDDSDDDDDDGADGWLQDPVGKRAAVASDEAEEDGGGTWSSVRSLCTLLVLAVLIVAGLYLLSTMRRGRLPPRPPKPFM
jgi:hypothetical protein